MTKVLRNPKDWISLTHVGVVLGTLVALYLVWPIAPIWARALLGLVAVLTGIYTNYVAHNHSHRGISDIPAVNRLLDFVLAFTSGTPLVFWRLHHVQNHHRYEGTQKDWSWNFNFSGCRFPDKPIPWWYYSITFTPIVFCQVTLHVLRRPFSRDFYDYFVSLAILIAANVLFFMWNWQVWLATNGVIYLSAPFFLGFANYFHHYACPDRRGLRAANDFTDYWSNMLSYNIGYHIEHSMRPQMHWSELPSFYRSHAAQIPTQHIAPSFFPGGGTIGKVNKWLQERAAQADYTGFLPQPSEWFHPTETTQPESAE